VNVIEPNKDSTCDNCAAQHPFLSNYEFGCFFDGRNISQIKFENTIYSFCDVNGLPDKTGFGLIFSGDAVTLLTMPNPKQLIDERGEPLEPDLPAESLLLRWRRTDGKEVVMPFVSPRVYNGAEVVPIMKWGGGKDRHLFSGWQVWLINRKTNASVKVIENPFVVLEQNQRFIFNEDAGFIEGANFVADSL
jgi:hypothetical protein